MLAAEVITILRDLTAFPSCVPSGCIPPWEIAPLRRICVRTYVRGEYEMLITLIPGVLGFRYFALKPFYMPQCVLLAATVPRVSRRGKSKRGWPRPRGENIRKQRAEAFTCAQTPARKSYYCHTNENSLFCRLYISLPQKSDYYVICACEQTWECVFANIISADCIFYINNW